MPTFDGQHAFDAQRPPTCECKEDGDLEALALNNLDARGGACGRYARGDGVYAVQRAGENEVLVGRELREPFCEIALEDEAAGLVDDLRWLAQRVRRGRIDAAHPEPEHGHGGRQTASLDCEP